MEIERNIGPKGQVVIPMDVRNKVGLKPGSDVVFEVVDDKIIMKKKLSPKEIVDDFADVPKKIKGLNANRLKEISEEEYEIP